MESNDNQTQIRCSNVNKLPIQGDTFLYESITADYKYNFDYYSVISLFFQTQPRGGSLTLYSSL